MRSRTLAGKLMVLPLLAVLAFLLLLSGGRPAHAASITVDTTSDELNADGHCSLREAIQAANTDSAVDACAGGSGADTIVVPAGTYTLSIAGAGEDGNATGDLDITTDLTINGAGAATTIIDGAGLDRVFDIRAGTVEISGLTIQNGNGGIRSGGTGEYPTVTLTDSAVRNNTGVGIDNNGPMTVMNSTVSGNTGGGIINYFASLTVVNSTVSGNVSESGFAGGISISGFISTILNSTVTNNSGDGIWFFNPAGLGNTIVAGNTPADCRVSAGPGGHNLDSDGTCKFTGPGDLPNTDPVLVPLADNGGSTQTHALLAGSPAINAGSGDCPPPHTDQRGVTRPQGPACDIGAYEASQPVGGIAELSELDGTPLGSGDSSGVSVGRVAGVAGLAAAAVLSLGGAAWYVRRRWLG